jgi:hypothetical protein
VHNLIAEQCSGQKSIGSKENWHCNILAREIQPKLCGSALSRGGKLWIEYKFAANTGLHLSCATSLSLLVPQWVFSSSLPSVKEA